ncbi:uncharacterized protein RAG0_10881 [Rhynchosporium agropyri]|uniref:Uncharacterized protein n=2 Tax=Rhynchosporium TaxID=38037 RepID=A0A1E1M4H6_RHYSE|nr:uncharacterized protein RAG0_10881 [Rhynchosporium agropyri]CZT43997.1 uncharacterized protein RSE6_04115 [Rhynchosporium secalis]
MPVGGGPSGGSTDSKMNNIEAMYEVLSTTWTARPISHVQ